VQVPQSKFKALKDKLPPVCFAIKYPIKNLMAKKDKLPDLNVIAALLVEESEEPYIHKDVKCLATNVEIVGARYYGRPPEDCGKDKVFNYHQKAIFQVNECDLNPVIFLRLARPLKDPKVELPVIKPVDFYEPHATAIGIDIEIKPDYRSFISETLIDLNSELFKKK
jgi:hypothetical protein